ncbi:MAG: hypothetical protein JO023_27505 [Chloroflexi bacterium]|nr:hypothetical protein [Chloroflexota bacterium]
MPGPGLSLVRSPSARELVCGLALALPVFVASLVMAGQSGAGAPWTIVTALILAVIAGGLGAALGWLWDVRAPRRRRRRRPLHRYSPDGTAQEPPTQTEPQARVSPRLSARERGHQQSS